MRNKFIISLSVLALLISGNSHAKTTHKPQAKSHHSYSKIKHKKSVTTQNPKVPAIGSSGQNTDTVLYNTPIMPSPDSLITEPVAIETRKVIIE